MKAQNIDQLISLLEERVEQHIDTAVRIFQNLDEATLLKPSDTGGWSIAQCLEHLNRYGDYYLPEIKRRLEPGEKRQAGTVFKSSWLGTYFTNMMEPAKSTKKIKAFKAYIPQQELDAYTVVSEFITQQEQLLQYLKDARNYNLNSIKLPISISRFIRLNLGDVFQFLVAHDERHLQQANRNLEGDYMSQTIEKHSVQSTS
jgi:hypothetical protein